MVEEQFKELNEKLDKIIRLLALGLVKDFNFQKEKIMMLSSLGYKPSDIAEFIGTTSNTVSVTIFNERKKEREQY